MNLKFLKSLQFLRLSLVQKYNQFLIQAKSNFFSTQTLSLSTYKISEKERIFLKLQ